MAAPFSHDATAQKELTAGTRIDHYEVIRRIGRGGMGEVYLARDTILGRKVALKLVDEEAMGTVTSKQQFLFEARATARFNHPHIITIYGVGEHRDRPFVALEYLEGQNLRERITERNPGVKEIIRIGAAIADALCAAHAAGVLHRDLKPENVFLPKDGRLRVLDFGLAQIVERGDSSHPAHPDPSLGQRPTLPAEEAPGESYDSENTLRGTPGYMAPEQWKGEPATIVSDVWAFGVLMYELLAGHRPFEGRTPLAVAGAVCSPLPAPPLPVKDEIPSPLADLVLACLEKDPGSRPTPTIVRDELNALLGPRDAPTPAREASPFRGLLPFTERQAELFFGRDTEVAEFVERLRDEPALPVVGPSGAGKSSFVRAGVIPRLREQGRWMVIQLRPGRAPFESLLAHIGKAVRDLEASDSGDDVFSRTIPLSTTQRQSIEALLSQDVADAELRDVLIARPATLSMLLARLADSLDARVLLFVDQLEELATLCTDDRECDAFLEALCRAADDPMQRQRVIFTVRDDFLAELARTESARRVLARIAVLRAPGPEALAEILRRPLERAGYRFDDPNIADEMIEDVRGEPAALPLLQFAGQLLWERRDRENHLLRRSVYEEFGRVPGALAHHAEGVLEGLSPGEVRTAKALLVRLVTDARTRKIVPRNELLAGLGAEAPEILARLIEARTVSLRKAHTEDGEGPEVELVHEALIQKWQRLGRWLDESREETAFLAEVGTAAQLWIKRGRPKDEVWRDDALTDALLRAKKLAAVPEDVRQFLDASKRRQKLHVLRKRLIFLALTLTLSAIVVVLSLQNQEVRRQRDRAESRRREAIRSQAEALTEGAIGALRAGDLVEAHAKLRSALELADTSSARAVWWSLSSRRLRWARKLDIEPSDLSVSADGRWIAVAGFVGGVHLVETDSRAMRLVPVSAAATTAVAFSGSGKALLVGNREGLVSSCALDSGKCHTVTTLSAAVEHLHAASRGDRFTTVDSIGTVRVFEGDELKLELPADPQSRAWLSPSGEILAVAGLDSSVRLHEVAAPEKTRSLTGHLKAVRAAAFSGDGAYLVTAGWDKTARVWDLHSQKTVFVARGHTDTVESVDFSDDGRRLVTAGNDKTVRLWDARAKTLLDVLEGHSAAIEAVRFIPGEKLLTTADAQGNLRLWRAEMENFHRVDRGHRKMVVALAFSPDGSRIASGGRDGTVRIWQSDTAQQLAVLRGHSAGVGPVAYHPGGNILAATGGHDNIIRLWDVQRGAELARLRGHTAPVLAVDFSPNGSKLVSAGRDRAVMIWDVAHRMPIAELSGHASSVTSVDFDPTGRYVVTGGNDGTARLWDTKDKALLKTFEGHTAAIHGVRFHPDGAHIVSGGSDNRVLLFHRDTGESQVLLEAPTRIYEVAVSSDGRRIAASLADGRLALIEKKGDAVITRQIDAHKQAALFVEFSPKNDILASAGADGTVRAFDPESGRPIWRAPFVSRNDGAVLTHRGWSATPPGGLLRDWTWREVLEGAVRVEQSPSTAKLCIQTYDDELLSVARGMNKKVLDAELPPVADFIARDDGCAVLTKAGAVNWYGDGAQRTVLATGASAVASAPSGLAVATQREILIIDNAGRIVRRDFAEPGITALALSNDWIAVGDGRGDIELRPNQSGSLASELELAALPASRVERLALTGNGTLAAGFQDGTVGVWSLESGALLEKVALHGPIIHLWTRNQKLEAASELGDFAGIDFSLFETPYCRLLQTVWEDVPLAWHKGRVVSAPAPKNHPCFPPAPQN